MKIDSEFVKKIFNLEIKIKNHEDKIKLSKYEELIPMYDIYSQKIYPIKKWHPISLKRLHQFQTVF